jgi:hypothetical protein
MPIELSEEQRLVLQETKAVDTPEEFESLLQDAKPEMARAALGVCWAASGAEVVDAEPGAGGTRRAAGRDAGLRVHLAPPPESVLPFYRPLECA